ncbi:hypothetical protein BKA93DRAFT_741931 [Sparassis latifolia]
MTDIPSPIGPTLEPSEASLPNSYTVKARLPITTSSCDVSSFEALLKTADLPLPGPAYFCARRALWWAPGPCPAQVVETSPSRRKLENLLNEGGAEESKQVWDAGLAKVWESLVSGVRLKKRLPLSMVIKILKAGWIQDGTWPRGGVAPEPDDVLESSIAQIEQIDAE